MCVIKISCRKEINDLDMTLYKNKMKKKDKNILLVPTFYANSHFGLYFFETPILVLANQNCYHFDSYCHFSNGNCLGGRQSGDMLNANMTNNKKKSPPPFCNFYEKKNYISSFTH